MILALVALALVLGVPYFEALRNANERPRLLQGMALVDCGQWAIDGPSARGLSPGPDVSRSPVDNRLYPNKPPMTSLVAALAYRIGQVGDAPTLRSYTVWARLLGGWLPTVLLCFWFWRRLAPKLGAAPVAAAIAIYALATPAASYAHLLYGHQLAAAFLLTGSLLVVDAVLRRQRFWAAIGASLAALSITVEYGAVFAGLPLALFLLLALARGGRGALPAVAAAALAAVVPMILLAAYHAAVFGSPWATGYHHVINPDFAAKHGQGLLGLGLPRIAGIHEQIFAADTGLLWWAPLCPVALFGLVGLSRRVDDPILQAEARVLFAMLLLFMLLTVSLSFTGGWRVGPRYLVVVLPAMIPGLAWLLRECRRRTVIFTALVALATWSLVVNGLAANLWPHIDPTNVDFPLAEVLVPLARAGAEPYDLLSVSGVGDLPLAAIVAMASVVSVVGGLLWVVCGQRSGIGAVVLGVGIGLVGVGASLRLPAHPRAAANLAYIQRVWEPEEGAANLSVELKNTDKGPNWCGSADHYAD
ncbi:MAG TPA: hypothetical protein ENK31_05895 [Nannocystis exedens]|nr:hypothetical protein [Nannocystis exedens]